MHRARAFFYVAAGVFLLALSYHLGARSAGAQVGSSVVGVSSNPAASTYWWVMTPNGEIYMRSAVGGGLGPLTLIGNFWDGPTPAHRESFGALKSRYRGERGAGRPTQDR
jgi:hypothetical protein